MHADKKVYIYMFSFYVYSISPICLIHLFKNSTSNNSWYDNKIDQSHWIKKILLILEEFRAQFINCVCVLVSWGVQI